MENELNNIKQESQTLPDSSIQGAGFQQIHTLSSLSAPTPLAQSTGEALFDKLNKVITSWFELIKNTVWVLSVFLGIFTFGGIIFFGYDVLQVRKEIKMRLAEIETTSKELNAKVAAIDSLRLETEDQLKSIAAHYNKNFEIIRRELVKKANVKLSEDIVPYTPELKPRQ